MATMQEIEKKAQHYAEARAVLAAQITALEDEITSLKRRRLSIIKKQVSAAKVAREALYVVINESAELFDKPRTQTFHGIRVGLQKGKGEIAFDDVDQVVKLIRKHRADDFDLLVKTTYKPIKKALANLPAAELKKLGIEVAETGDVVFIKDAAGDVDKLVNALLGDVDEEVEA